MLNLKLSNIIRLIINYIWFGSFPYYILLLPLSLLYGFIIIIINLSYRYGLRKIYSFSLPIIVIGNITVGGNGKTPVVLWLIEKLQKRGWKVGVISRGYGSKRSNKRPFIVNSTTKSYECGDEPLLIWQRTGVMVAVASKRSDAVMELLQTHQKFDIIVSDDGLQHQKLARDIEWIVIDGNYRLGNGWWLPAGPMREFASRMNTVNKIIINGGIVKGNEIYMQLLSNGLVINLLNGERRKLTSLWTVVAIAGIGYPARFFSTLRTYGIIPIKEISFDDHQIYQEKLLSALTPNGEILIMTEKDAIKCRSFPHSNWWYLPVDASFSKTDEKNLLDSVELSIKKYYNIDHSIVSN